MWAAWTLTTEFGESQANELWKHFKKGLLKYFVTEVQQERFESCEKQIGRKFTQCGKRCYFWLSRTSAGGDGVYQGIRLLKTPKSIPCHTEESLKANKAVKKWFQSCYSGLSRREQGAKYCGISKKGSRVPMTPRSSESCPESARICVLQKRPP